MPKALAMVSPENEDSNTTNPPCTPLSVDESIEINDFGCANKANLTSQIVSKLSQVNGAYPSNESLICPHDGINVFTF